jgi:hypothetical protein
MRVGGNFVVKDEIFNRDNGQGDVIQLLEDCFELVWRLQNDAKEGHSADPMPAQSDLHDVQKDSGTVTIDDASSDVSSSGQGGSVFSIETRNSLTSAATDLSGNSGYSTTEIEIATSILLSVLADDEVLVLLYHSALRDDSVDPQRFENNFRRLLKLYSKQLQEEARDSLEHLAARLVLFKARSLAKSIVQKFGGSSQQTTGAQHVRSEPELQDEDSDQEEDKTSYESIFDDLTKVREFWIRSGAFQMLRKNLAMFVARSRNIINRSPPDVTDPTIKVPPAPTYGLIQSHFATVLPRICGLLIQMGVIPDACPPDMERIEWKCVSVFWSLLPLWIIADYFTEVWNNWIWRYARNATRRYS